MPSPPVVVGVDGSDSSLDAADWAADEALLHGLPLRLVYASLWQRYEDVALSPRLSRPEGRAMAENIVGSTAERILRRAPDLPVTTALAGEEPVSALLREGQQAFALVTGSRGRGGISGLLLGSVSLAVAARAQCPAIVVRGDKAGLEARHERIALGVGDFPAGSTAVRFAFAEAQLRGCGIDVVRAWRCPSGEEPHHPPTADGSACPDEDQASALLDEALSAAVRDHPEVPVRRVTTEGSPRKVLLERSAVADLLVVGAEHRHTHPGMQLSGAAHTVLHHAACPVAVVPCSSPGASEGTTP
ncbi:universal stress protein [Streptomyces sp. NPDC057428]|uniref:universal stress protein n=1 Tax=Streptomyces sp. NPDC057428 TaxID=3346129 RepID=UPI0036BE7AC2